MTAKHLFSLALAASITATNALAGTVIADDKKIVTPPEKEFPMGKITFGYKGSEDLQSGFIDSVTPFLAPGNAVFFLSSRSTLDDSDQYISSLGLGARYLFPDHDIII